MTFDEVVARMVEIASLPVALRKKELEALEKVEVSTAEGRCILRAGMKALSSVAGVHVEETETLPDRGVSLSAVMQGVARYIQRYLRVDDVTELLVAYYILMSWFVPHLRLVPYLYAKSQGPGYGKSQLAAVLRNLCARAVFTESISVAALAQLYETHSGLTLVLDEIDNWNKRERSEIFALFKASIRPGTGRIVLRQDATKAASPIQQDCYGPKVFLGIKSVATFDDALFSRCLVVEMMESHTVMPHVPPFKEDEVAAQLRSMCATLATQYGSGNFDRHPALRSGLEKLSSRQFDTIEPLLILASIADAERGVSEGGDVDALKSYALGELSHGADESYEKLLLVEVRSAVEVFQEELSDLSGDARVYGYVEQEVCHIVNRPPQWKTPQGEGNFITKLSLIRGLGGELGIHQLELYAQLLRQEDSALYRPPENLRQKTTAQGVLKPIAFAEIIRRYARSKSSGAIRYFSLDELNAVLIKQTGEGIRCLASLKQRYLC